MRLLLDTHILLWALTDPSRLSSSVRDALEDPANIVLFSAASVWEASIKAALGRTDFQFSPQEIVASALDAGFTELPVRSTAAMRVADLPHHHRDPFDRLLVAQAMDEPAMLYTSDAQLRAYGNLVVWLIR